MKTTNKKILYSSLISLITCSFLITNVFAQKTPKCRTSTKISKIKDMNYHNARKLLLKEEWVPIQPIYPKDKNPFALTIYERFKPYPEVQGCSGTGLGFCTMFLTNQNYDILVITTVGEDDPNGKYSATVSQVKAICY